MLNLLPNQTEFNSNYVGTNLEGKIKFLVLLPVAKKNYFLRPVARCKGGG
ncbi:MAG: hypothetical protein WC460_02870 [Patescibacteria group bacterium]